VFEAQHFPTVADRVERAGIVDVYAVVFALLPARTYSCAKAAWSPRCWPSASTPGSVVHLANHPTAARTHPWATRLNLERAIEALAARMDREHDAGGVPDLTWRRRFPAERSP
jgi:hypothetical protein